jgi:hypothetical protein
MTLLTDVAKERARLQEVCTASLYMTLCSPLLSVLLALLLPLLMFLF